jgi:hypothetical protein
VKALKIFALGFLGLAIVLAWRIYEPYVAALCALAVVAIVGIGFVIRPRKEVFYVPTTLTVDDDGDFAVEHDYIAVRVEITRLWLLFIPTFAALAFLIVTAAKGIPNGVLWEFNPFHSYSSLFIIVRYPLAAVVAILYMWLTERWVVKDADACSVRWLSGWTGAVSYSFVDHFGEYYGGNGVGLGLVRDPDLATIVLYRPTKPDTNKIVMCCLFHRLVVIGRGITDLDEATVAGRLSPVQTTS